MDLQHCHPILMLMLIRIIASIASIDDETQLIIVLIRSTLPLIDHAVEAEVEVKTVYQLAPATDVRRALREKELPIPREVEAAEVVKNYCRVCPLMVVVAEAHQREEAEAHHTE